MSGWRDRDRIPSNEEAIETLKYKVKKLEDVIRELIPLKRSFLAYFNTMLKDTKEKWYEEYLERYGKYEDITTKLLERLS